MNAALDRDQPGKIASGVMAVAVHVAFFALLVFGVNWQHKAPDAVMVELWGNLPPVPSLKPPPEPVPPKLEVKPPLVQPPQIKPEPKATPKPAPEPKPTIKPDISLEKEKQEKARLEREKAEKKKRDDQATTEAKEREKADQKKREEQQKLAALERAKEAETARLQKEQELAAQRLQQQLAAAQGKEVDEYRRRMADKIRRYVNKEPCAALGNPEIVFEAVLLPDGNLLPPPRIRRSSGNAACDDAVLRAVMRAQPLPLPPDPALFARFRELNLQFRPND